MPMWAGAGGFVGTSLHRAAARLPAGLVSAVQGVGRAHAVHGECGGRALLAYPALPERGTTRRQSGRLVALQHSACGQPQRPRPMRFVDPTVRCCLVDPTATLMLFVEATESRRSFHGPSTLYLMHLHRDWAYPCHICTGTGLALPHLHRDQAHPGHICTGTALGGFYTWFFHMLPFLAWSTRLPTPVRVLIIATVDYAFDVRLLRSHCSSGAVREAPTALR